MTDRYDILVQRLQSGHRVLLDGGTGTELERRGVPTVADAWSGGGAMTHPATVRDVHAAYIAAGAEIVISNTFGTSRHALADAGYADRFEMLNRRGVELPDEARTAMGADDVLVAGGITNWSWTSRQPPLDELRASVETQAGIMAAAGADLLMLEMMVDVERFLTVLDGARTSGLPVWVGFSCGDTADGVVRLLRYRTRAHPGTRRAVTCAIVTTPTRRGDWERPMASKDKRGKSTKTAASKTLKQKRTAKRDKKRTTTERSG